MASFDPQYWDFDTNAYSNFDHNADQDANFNSIARQQHYASHRASDPMSFIRPQLPMDESIDLSHFDAMAQDAAHNVGLEEVIKPEHNTPWSGTQHHGIQQQAPPFTLHGPHAKSEPAMKQDRTSEADDSAYYSLQAGGGMQQQVMGHYSINQEEVEQNYLPTMYISKPAVNRKSVVSAGPSTQPRERRVRGPLALCAICEREPKNQSDAKKHELTHTRPYRCVEPDCNRKDGFATENDLQRHRKSVHNLLPTVGSTAGYICAACPPERNAPAKFWPRRDNFKAHIKRKHRNHNEAVLIQESRRSMRPDDTQTVVDTDVQSVRSAMQSVHQSQIDPSEGHGYQSMSHMDALPTLSRNASNQGDFAGVFGPDFAVSMANGEDALVGMQGHTADLGLPNGYYNSTFIGEEDSNRLSIHSSAANNVAYSNNINNHNTASPSTARQSFSAFSHRPPPPSFSSSQPLPSSSTTSGPLACPYPSCNTTWNRSCDLTKHIKRHTKPYGCTFPHCAQKSGSRGDWKRHENSNHYMNTMWRCGRMKLDGSMCVRRPFQREESLRAHLAGPEHGMGGDEVALDRAVEEGRLGEEGKGQFWCRFCVGVVMQTEGEGEGAWQARLRHVGDHFDRDGLSIDEWVCVVENRKKKYIVEREERRKEGAVGKKEEEEMEELPEWRPDFDDDFALVGMV